MDWTLFWQIAGPIIGLLGIGVMVYLFLWPRIEKIKITIGRIDYNVDAVIPKIKVYWGSEFQRSGAKEVRYITQILLKPDKQTYMKLCQYFKLPEDGIIKINVRLKLPRNETVSSFQGGEPPFHPVYKALPEILRTAETRDAAKQTASELSQKAYKVRLVWDDGGKTKWKIIAKEDYDKWVKL